MKSRRVCLTRFWLLALGITINKLPSWYRFTLKLIILKWRKKNLSPSCRSLSCLECYQTCNLSDSSTVLALIVLFIWMIEIVFGSSLCSSIFTFGFYVFRYIDPCIGFGFALLNLYLGYDIRETWLVLSDQSEKKWISLVLSIVSRSLLEIYGAQMTMISAVAELYS